MSDDESDDSIPVEATTHPFDESAVLDVDDYDEGVENAQDLLENSSSYIALIEVDEGTAIATDAEDSEPSGGRVLAQIGMLLRDAAADYDLSVVEAVKIALKLSDPSGWTDSGTRTLPGYLREAGEEQEDGE
jgi:hypothetical protein